MHCRLSVEVTLWQKAILCSSQVTGTSDSINQTGGRTKHAIPWYNGGLGLTDPKLANLANLRPQKLRWEKDAVG
jgi:hypothetical protein